MQMCLVVGGRCVHHVVLFLCVVRCRKQMRTDWNRFARMRSWLRFTLR